MNKHWKTWLIVFFAGTSVIFLIRSTCSSDTDTTTQATNVEPVVTDTYQPPPPPPPPPQQDRCVGSIEIDGQTPDHLFCDTGTTLTESIYLRTGMVKMAMVASRTSGIMAFCRAELLDSNGQSVGGTYNGIMLRDVSSDRAMWATRIEIAGNYTARISGGRCRWTFGISQ